MKKTLLFSTALALSAGAFAQGTIQTKMLPDFYTMRMSPDGKVIAGFISEDTYLYNLNTEQITELTGFQIGNGNALSGDGRIAVGGTGQDQAGIVIGTELILPENLSSYTLCSLHGITADGTLICGTIENKKRTRSDVCARRI